MSFIVLLADFYFDVGLMLEPNNLVGELNLEHCHGVN